MNTCDTTEDDGRIHLDHAGIVRCAAERVMANTSAHEPRTVEWAERSLTGTLDRWEWDVAAATVHVTTAGDIPKTIPVPFALRPQQPPVPRARAFLLEGEDGP